MSVSSSLMRNIDRVLAALLTLALVPAGASKLAALPMHVENFARWGFPSALMYVVGGAELLLAIGLWLRPLRAVAPVGLMAVLSGAVLTHLLKEQGANIAPAAVLLAMAATVGHLRRDELFARLRRTRSASHGG